MIIRHHTASARWIDIYCNNVFCPLEVIIKWVQKKRYITINNKIGTEKSNRNKNGQSINKNHIILYYRLCVLVHLMSDKTFVKPIPKYCNIMVKYSISNSKIN